MSRLYVLAALTLALVCAGCSGGTVLTVGPGKEYRNPSDAAQVARSGDTVEIFPGNYKDCAVWTQNHLIIEGKGRDVTVGHRTCAGKGVFVIRGDDVTIRNLTITGARAFYHNGAGIRSEGDNLLVEHMRFIDNENGILTSHRRSTTIVRYSYFQGNGSCIDECAHGIYVSHPGLLRIEHCEFVGQHSGHHVKSRASVTELVDNVIQDGPDGTASYLVDIPQGGAVTITANRFEKGPHAENFATAIAIGGEPKLAQNPGSQIVLENNEFVSDVGKPTVFVRNYTQTPAVLKSNHIRGAVQPLAGPGTVSCSPTFDWASLVRLSQTVGHYLHRTGIKSQTACW